VQEGNLMLRPDRLAATVRGHGKSLITAGSKHAAAVRGSRKSLVLAGTALALAGAGAATVATAATASRPPPPRPVTAQAHHVGPAYRVGPAYHVGPPVARLSQVGEPIAVLVGGAKQRPAASQAPASHPAALTWAEVSDAIGRQTLPPTAPQGKLGPADRLIPVRTSGPQASMPVGSAQIANATTIVRQALGQRMGIRSAVIAVATAMQESMLQNINYGTGTALGLFQQQPDSGWGTPAQVMRPTYAARAFLSALRRHQAGDPSWARQPLWANAQAVQNSAFPYAYAKWESQAASLVRQITMHEVARKVIAVKLR
jgi:hypothetical protein